jgi:hypothetical protein
MCDGMAVMTHRSTFALDKATNQRIKSLAKLWKVSQAEVVRRAVSFAEMMPKTDPVAMLQELHDTGKGLTVASAKEYLAEVRQDRKSWRGK